MPLYFIAHFAASAGEGNAALTVILLSGRGNAGRGRVADRIGRGPILVGCMAVLPPLILLVLLSGPAVSFILLGLVGFFTIGNFSITVVLGQEFLPRRIGIASG